MTVRRLPACGEVWLCPEGSVLPSGMLCLVISSDRYHRRRDQRIVVEVIGERLAAAGGILIDLGPVGSAVADTPTAVSLHWFDGADEPVATVDPAKVREVTDALRDLLGP